MKKKIAVIRALAAGNNCFIKPSEFSPATAKLLAKLVSNYFSPDVLTGVNGDASLATQKKLTQWLSMFPAFLFFYGILFEREES